MRVHAPVKRARVCGFQFSRFGESAFLRIPARADPPPPPPPPTHTHARTQLQVLLRVDGKAEGPRLKALDRELYAMWNSEDKAVIPLRQARHLEFDVYADKDQLCGIAFFKLEYLLADPALTLDLPLEPEVRVRVCRVCVCARGPACVFAYVCTLAFAFGRVRASSLASARV